MLESAVDDIQRGAFVADEQDALQAGEVDWLDQPLPDLIPTMQRNRNIQVEVLNPYGIMSIMRLNHLQAPCWVRRAGSRWSLSWRP